MMKKFYLAIITLLLMIPGLGVAEGSYCPGFVEVVIDDTDGKTAIKGTYNVRWSTEVKPFGSEYIYVFGVAGTTSPVKIVARDGDNGLVASCYISPDNPLYADAMHLRRQNGDGTLIKTYKLKGSNECVYLSTRSDSCYLH